MGMPGLGALGVTFDSVVAMDSPSGRPPGSFHWASTLWHEMSHVYVLQATNNRVPRWFTEGLAVYEETAASPDWGDRLDLESIHAMQNKMLLPVAELDRGFIRPSYPSQVIVSYFQGGKILTYIAEKWGYSKLLDMIHAYRQAGIHAGRFQKRAGHLHPGLRQRVPGLAGRALAKSPSIISMNGAADQDHGRRFARQEIRRRDPDRHRDSRTIRITSRSAASTNCWPTPTRQRRQGRRAQGAGKIQSRRRARPDAGGTTRHARRSRPANPQKAAAALESSKLHLSRRSGAAQTIGRSMARTEQSAGGNSRIPGAARAEAARSGGVRIISWPKRLQKANQCGQARDEVLPSLEAAPGFKPAQKLLLEIAK